MCINTTKNTVALLVHQLCYREVIKFHWALQTMLAVRGTVNKLNGLEGAPRTADYLGHSGKDSHDGADQAQFSARLSQDTTGALYEHSA